MVIHVSKHFPSLNVFFFFLFCSYRSNAEYLQGLVPDARVVKGFNVLSAYALENGGLQGSKEVSNQKLNLK